MGRVGGGHVQASQPRRAFWGNGLRIDGPRGAERSHCSEWGALDGFLPSSDVVWGRPGGEGREKEGNTPGQGFLA